MFHVADFPVLGRQTSEEQNTEAEQSTARRWTGNRGFKAYRVNAESINRCAGRRINDCARYAADSKIKMADRAR